MSKRIEKEPLLFVDTGYLGCYVVEQTYFKTPTEKPQNISQGDYVHNYAQDDFFDFDQFKRPSEEAGSKSNKLVEIKEESLPSDEEYERVDILVDDDQLEEVDEPTHSTMQLEFNSFNNIHIEEVEVEDKASKQVGDEDLSLLDEEQSVSNVTMDDPEDEGTDSNEEVVEIIDEKQRELLLLIQDLTNLPSQMKAPIVQVIQKDGMLKSGILNLKDEQTVVVDNLMNELEEISIVNIEGIRILHM